MRNRGGLGCVGLAIILLGLAGCGGVVSRSALPVDRLDEAEIPGMQNVRFWGDVFDPRLAEAMDESWRQEHAALGTPLGTPLPPTSDIAISGGGPDGAFGAGLLIGWSDLGTRPSFKIVTGVSTGALMAPWVFLGPDYDPILREVYTNVDDDSIFTRRPLGAMIRGDSFADTGPLARLTARYITEEVLDHVAAEHRKGRRLFIGTTNLDAQRPVVWDMGAIASSDSPGRLELFRKVLLASASIPALFPPQYIDVELDGGTFQEMHVDGGVTRELFLYPIGLRLLELRERLGVRRDETRVYLLVNNTLDPQPMQVRPRIGPIAGRSISTLIKSQARGDLLSIYFITRNDQLDFNLAAIPADFKHDSQGIFDQKYMQALFDLGYTQAKSGYTWSKFPPGLEESETIIPIEPTSPGPTTTPTTLPTTTPVQP